MVSITGISHVAVGTRDMERALTFYRDVIGLKVRFDEVENQGVADGRFVDHQPSEMANAAKAEPARRRGVYLEYSSYLDHPTAGFLVLDQQLTCQPFGEPAEFYQVAIHHFGFWVDDLDEIAERARSLNMPPYYGPKTSDSKGFGEAPGRQVRTALFRDPDGNIVQCDQRLAL